MISGAALAAVTGFTTGAETSLASVTVGPRLARTGCDTLVILFLRGGADGLNIIIPFGDEHYYRLRPNLALPAPSDRTMSVSSRAINLDGFYGLHPSLAPLLPLYLEGKFAAVHAVGSGDHTLSHFQAMATMERGLYRDSGAASGWLARHLNATASDEDSPLRAVALTDTMPDTLRGANSAAALTTLTDFRLIIPEMPTGSDGKAHHNPFKGAHAMTECLKTLYKGDTSSSPQEANLARGGAETLRAMDTLKGVTSRPYHPDFGAKYPKGSTGHALQQVACLIKAGVGLETAFLNVEGWDTHVAQGRDTGWQPSRLSILGTALSAFSLDIGVHLDHTTIVVMTEFGRRAYENTGLGTDHGRASCMLILGGGVQGGKVYAKWPGLDDQHLVLGGDLHVTTDYRDVLAEILSRRLRNSSMTSVFPDFIPHPLGITRSG